MSERSRGMAKPPKDLDKKHRSDLIFTAFVSAFLFFCLGILANGYWIWMTGTVCLP